MQTKLSAWLKSQLKERRVTAHSVAVGAGVGAATISGILNTGRIPQINTLLCLADYFDTPRTAVLRLAADLPFEPLTGRWIGRASPPPVRDEDYLLGELLEAFRQVPDEWKEDVIAEVGMWARMTSRQGIHIIGAEGQERDEEERSQKAPRLRR